jgi:hypothetical protein
MSANTQFIPENLSHSREFVPSLQASPFRVKVGVSLFAHLIRRFARIATASVPARSTFGVIPFNLTGLWGIPSSGSPSIPFATTTRWDVMKFGKRLSLRLAFPGTDGLSF